MLRALRGPVPVCREGFSPLELDKAGRVPKPKECLKLQGGVTGEKVRNESNVILKR